MVEPASPEAPFVGREELLRELHQRLAATRSGRGHLVLIGGEPGIGKTTLARRFVESVPPDETLVLRATCWDGAGAPALWPWVQILRALVTARQAPMSVDRLAPAAAELHRLLPGVASGSVAMDTGGGDPETARFRLFDAVGSALRLTGVERPVLIVLDDLQWADAASLLLLRFLQPELPTSRLMVLGCYRDVDLPADHPFRQLLGERTGEQSLFRLSGLTPEHVAMLLAQTAGADVEPAVAARVHRATGGNPFFVREMVRLVLAPGTQHHQRLLLGDEIPPSVRETVRRRLARLSAPCIDLLAAASVAGAEFALDLVAEIAGVTVEQAARHLDEAVAARLIDDRPASGAVFAFTHALVREVVHAALPRSRRVELHRRAAESIERRFADDLEPRLAELAYHFGESAVGAGGHRAVTYAERAGHHALDLFAYEDAAAQFQRALELLRLDVAATGVPGEQPSPARTCLPGARATRRRRAGQGGAAPGQDGGACARRRALATR